MIKPNVKILSDNGIAQRIQLEHPDKTFRAVIHLRYADNPGAKLDINDDARIRRLWESQIKRSKLGTQRETAPEKGDDDEN